MLTSNYCHRLLNLLSSTCFCLLFTVVFQSCLSAQQQEYLTPLKSDPLTIDLYHKLDSNQDFKLRGSIVVKPRTEHRAAQANLVNQADLSSSDLNVLKEASARGDTYYLKAVLRQKKGDQVVPLKTTQTLVKTCSLYTSNLVDFITVNLSPLNEFISINLFTADHECVQQEPDSISGKFNTTVAVNSGAVGPIPDTATYIKRLEEERQNKAKEGKEDNRSFFAKYWIYIVPAVIILMIFSGPADQGGR